MTTPTTGAEGFYVTALHTRNRAAFLLGPYTAHSEALDQVDRARRFVAERDPDGWLYRYGTARAVAKPGRALPVGRLNDRLGLKERVGLGTTGGPSAS